MKYVKEATIMLLICLVFILILAVVLYEYIPSRKVVPTVTIYEKTSTVKEQLSDEIQDLDDEDDVILTFEQGGYEVTSTDLTTYQRTNKYVPGKADPFAAAPEAVDEDVSGTGTSSKPSSSGTSSSSSSSSGSSSVSGTSKEVKSSEYVRSNGGK